MRARRAVLAFLTTCVLSAPVCAQALVATTPAKCEPTLVPLAVAKATTLRFANALRLAEASSADKQRRAVDELEAITREQPWLVATHRALAKLEAARGRWPSAYVAYKRYLSFDVPEADKVRVRAELRELEKRSEALRVYADGESAAFSGDWARTMSLMKEVIAQKNTFALAYRLLGIAHASLAQPREAAEAYEQYLEYDPSAIDRDEVRKLIDVTRARLAESAGGQSKL